MWTARSLSAGTEMTRIFHSYPGNTHQSACLETAEMMSSMRQTSAAHEVVSPEYMAAGSVGPMSATGSVAPTSAPGYLGPGSENFHDDMDYNRLLAYSHP